MTFKPLRLSDIERMPCASVLTTGECARLFNLKSTMAVVTACRNGRVKARKASTDIGDKSGTWLVDTQDALHIWGYRLDKSNEHG